LIVKPLEVSAMMVPRVRLRVRTMMFAVAVAAVCLAIPLWGKTAYRNYQIARQLRYPVALDLWRGRIAAGDRIEHVTARNRPHRVTKRGPFVQLFYYPGGPPRAGSISLAGTCVVAKDGKLVAAGSWACTFQHTHFDVASSSDEAEFARLLQQYPGRRPDLGDVP
jgi:hypothetical protein